MRYHIWVANDGEVVCAQAEDTKDGYRYEPWRPFSFNTVESFVTKALDEVNCTLSIHTRTVAS